MASVVLNILFIFIFLIVPEKRLVNGTLNIKPNLFSNILQGVLELPTTQNRQQFTLPPRQQQRPKVQEDENTFSPKHLARYKDELLRYVLNEENILNSRLPDPDLINRFSTESITRFASNKNSTSFEEDDSANKVKEFSDVAWPDPDPETQTNKIMVDDVTQLNQAPVSGVFFPRTGDDVKHVLALARKERKPISMRGTKHSMGGHTIAENGFVIDTAKLDKITYDKDTKQAEVEPGVIWSDLVHHLNQYGMSPMSLQSYSSFSVGGSISVNAHGITSDYSLHQSIVKFTIIKWDGTEVVCKPDGDGESGDLFRLAIGGYGMFGVIIKVTLDVQPNARLRMDVIQTTSANLYPTYKRLINSSNVAVKLARIDVTNGEDCQLFVLTKDVNINAQIVSKLPLEPREMSTFNQLYYKWLLPSTTSLRYIIERSSYQALDWTDDNDLNLLIYESAEPLGKLYSPLFKQKDTFVLQEFFVPAPALHRWLLHAKSTLTKKYKFLTLLNLTIRFVHQDLTTYLSYSRAKEGSFAFVLYYRIRKSKEADEELATIHNEFTRISLELGGTFYLPYRHHYSKEQLELGYPNIERFFRKKLQYDPYNMFSSAWSKDYMTQIIPETENILYPTQIQTRGADDLYEPKLIENFQPNFVHWRKDINGCYRSLLSDPLSRQRFFEKFLTLIFNVEDNKKVESVVTKAIWNPTNTDDDDIFNEIRTEFAESVSSGPLPIGQITKLGRAIQQSRHQKQELTRETINIVSKLGRYGHLKDYVSIGDTGKMVLSFLEYNVINGKVWVVHNTLGELPEVIERGTEKEVGEFVFIDYEDPTTIDIPSESADLVTMNQGLHHQHQEKIMGFLSEVYRILRPGGLFIVREHDASPELYPTLYLAHSVFNAVTGRTLQEEKTERRNFRSILEWRKIIQSAGFKDTFLYEIEKGDPTVDEMMCFSKGSIEPTKYHGTKSSPNDVSHLRSSLVGILPKEAAYTLDAIIQEGPNVVLQFSKTIIDTILENANNLLIWSDYMAKTFATSGQEYIFTQAKDQYVIPILEMANVFRQTLETAEVDLNDNFELIPREFIALIKALIKKGKDGNASATELVLIGFITDAQQGIAGLADTSSVDTGNEEVDACTNVCFNSNSVLTPRQDGQIGSDVDSNPACDQFCALPIIVDSSLSEPPNTNNNQLETNSFEYNYIYEKMQTLLGRHPYMKDIRTFTKVSGIPKQIQRIMKTGLGGGNTITPEIITRQLLTYGDARSWKEIRRPLEEVIQSPNSNIFTLSALDNQRSAWYRAAMALLGSSHIQLNSYTITFATFAGMKKYVDMWQTAQKIRRTKPALDDSSPSHQVQKENMSRYKLTKKSEELLQSLTGLIQLKENVDAGAPWNAKPLDDVSIDLIVRSLVLSKVGKEKGLNGGYNWYKLPEWLQIDLVKIFGNYMEHRPWFLYPFMDMLKSYFNVLQEEAMIVYDKYGIQKAFLSGAFITSFIPGIVMLLLYAQLTLLAYPIQMGLASYYSADGDYSPQTKATQIEKLILFGEEERSVEDWKAIDDRIEVTLIIRGLYEITVPSLGYMSPILERIASNFPDVTLLRISNHDEVQVRVALYGKEDVDRQELVYRIRHGLQTPKVQYMFEYMLPTLGKAPQVENSGGLPLYVVLAIRPPYLLQFIREIEQMEHASLDQIYDFWA